MELVGCVLATLFVMKHMRETDPEMEFAGLIIIGGLGLALVGLILGFVSLGSQRKRIFGILGTIFNGVILLGVGFLMVVGMVSK